MNKSFPVFCILYSISCILLSGCEHDSLIERTGGNYFPIEKNNTWTYLRTQNNIQDTVVLRVDTTKTVFERTAWVIERNGYPEYCWISEQRIDKFYCETIFINGEEDTIISCWIPWLHFPFVLDEKKNYYFEQKKSLLQDTILTTIQIDYEVKKIDLKSNDYQIKIKLIKSRDSDNFGAYCDTTCYYEWYRQNVGLTERTFPQDSLNNSTNEKLLSYSLH